MEKLSRIIAACDYTLLSKNFTHHSKFLNDHETKMNNLHLEVDKLNHEIKNLNEDLDQVKSRKEENLKTDGSMKELEIKENQLSNDLTRLNTARDIAMDNLTEEKINTLN